MILRDYLAYGLLLSCEAGDIVEVINKWTAVCEAVIGVAVPSPPNASVSLAVPSISETIDDSNAFASLSVYYLHIFSVHLTITYLL